VASPLVSLQLLCCRTLPLAFAAAFQSDADDKLNGEAIKAAGGSGSPAVYEPNCGLLCIASDEPVSSRVGAVVKLALAVAESSPAHFTGVENGWMRLLAGAAIGDSDAVDAAVRSIVGSASRVDN